ncbi:hypothetical protein RK42_003239 [Escherichia coli]|nr:hypothetical protein [Escherichia coli]
MCRSNKAVAPHPTISAVPLPDATLARLISIYVESNLPAPGGSHPHELQMQKSLLVEQAFRIWSVIEDYSPLRGSPCGPLLAQRSLASLESNLRPLRPERSALPGCANHRMRGASYCADTPSSIP